MKKFVFSSFPDFSDNSLALFTEMLSLNIEGKYIWLYKDSTKLDEFKKSIQKVNTSTKTYISFIEKNSFKGIFNYLTSQYIFTTHGMFEQIPILPWQNKINLWHGMPLKTIGNLDNKKSSNIKMNFSLSNGQVFNEVIAEAFSINQKKVIKLGSPRNDSFFKENTFKFDSLFKNDKPVIAWLPTYRKSIIGDIRKDGKYFEKKISIFNHDDFEKLNEKLLKLEVNILIKLHSMDVLTKDLEFMNAINSFEAIKIVTDKDKIFSKYTLYEILAKTAGLITDYSSIYFDYLLLNRPIGILADDKDAYSESRGLIEKVAKYYKGEEILDESDFINFVTRVKEKKDARLLEDLSESKKYCQTFDKSGNNSKELLKFLELTDLSE